MTQTVTSSNKVTVWESVVGKGKGACALVIALAVVGCGENKLPQFAAFPGRSAKLHIEHRTESFSKSHVRTCSFTKEMKRLENFVALNVRFENRERGTSLFFQSSQGFCEGAVKVRNPTDFQFVTKEHSFRSTSIREGDCTLSISCDSSEIDTEKLLIKRVEVTFSCTSLSLEDGSKRKVVTQFTCE